MEVKSMIFLLLAVVVMCSAQKKCCFPDQFEALKSQTIGQVLDQQGGIYYYRTQFAFDYTNKRTAGLVTSYSTGKAIQNYQVISDYEKATQYVFFEKQRVCKKMSLPASMVHCVPSNATYIGSTYYGDKKVTTDDFAYYMNEPETMGNVTFGVTKGNCIPFGSTFTGTQDSLSTLILEGYSNYTRGIEDPSRYFTVPSYCPQSFSEEARIDNTLFGFFFF